MGFILKVDQLGDICGVQNLKTIHISAGMLPKSQSWIKILDWSSLSSRLLQLSITFMIDLLGYWYLYWYLAWVLSIGIGYWYWVLGMATIYTSLTSLLASLLLDRLLGVDPPAHRLLIGVLHSKYTVKGWKEYIVKRGDKSILSRVEKSILQRGEKNILSRSEKSILRRGEKRILSRGELNCNCLEVTWRPSSWSQQCQGVRNTQTQMHKYKNKNNKLTCSPK